MAKRIAVVVAALAAALLLNGRAEAFHDGGVAYCQGCHTMHNSQKGVAMNSTVAQFQGVNWLLKGADQSSTCLACHSGASLGSYKVMTYPVPAAGTAPVNYSPGGDFAYVQKSYSWTTSRGTAGSSVGERHGHNINASQFGGVTDATLAAAPGGTYAANQLHCSSCHDPHGQTRLKSDGTLDRNQVIGTASEPIVSSGSYGAPTVAGEAVGVYRLLGGTGYSTKSYPTHSFANNAPTAVAPATYNRKETATDTRVAYGQGMSEWCANCHTNIHNDTLAPKLIHPAGNAAKLTAAVVANYNAYVKSGDLTGTVATAYTSLVPYEEGTNDRSVLLSHAVNDGTQTAGPSTGAENVMCLSCHRAHASAFDSMVRWSPNQIFHTVEGAYPGNNLAPTVEGGYGEFHQGKTQTENQQALYDRPATKFASFQRSTCNKCHAKD